MLNKEQIKYGAMYLASSNTGLLGCGYDVPDSKFEIERIYLQISYEYEINMGEDLTEELEMWLKDLKTKPDRWEKVLREKVPFIFE